MCMRTHPCAQATVKMESDREIESSETEMETDEETFERDASAVPEDRLVSGMVKDPDLPVCQVCHVRIKTKHANTSNLYSHLKKHHPIEYQAGVCVCFCFVFAVFFCSFLGYKSEF